MSNNILTLILISVFFNISTKFIFAAEKSVLRAFISTERPRSFHPNANASGSTVDHFSQIYDTLFEIDSNGNLVPALATSWKRIDSTSILITLRKNIRFQNGEAFDSESVKFSIDLFLSDKENSETYLFGDTIKSIKVMDKYSVLISTKVPDNTIIHRLTLVGLIIPPKYYSKVGKEYFSTHPIGTGPYQVLLLNNEIEKDVPQITLIRNKYYWRKRVNFDEIRLIYFLSIEEALEKLKTGNIDFMIHVPGKFTKDIMSWNQDVKLLKEASMNGLILMINTKKDTFLRDINVRRFLQQSLNYQHILEYSAQGNGQLVETIDFRNSEKSKYNLIPGKIDSSKLKELLMKKHKLMLQVTDPYHIQGKIISKQLIDMGFNLQSLYTKDSEEISSVLERNVHKLAPIPDLLLSYCADLYGNGLFPLLVLMHSNASWSMTDDIHLDSLIDNVTGDLFNADLSSKIKKIIEYLYEQALIIPIMKPFDIFAVRGKIKYTPTKTGKLNFSNLEFN